MGNCPLYVSSINPMEAALLPTATPAPDARTARHDGYLWPLMREQMTTPAAIRDRMVEDIQTLVHDGGADAVVTLADLVRTGWTGEQVITHGTIAFSLWRAEHAPRPARRRIGQRDSARRMAIEAAALTIFFIPVAFWAGILTGVI